MTKNLRRAGLGLAARGDVRKGVAYAHAAAMANLDSVWVHDSYFERDAVTFLAAIAAAVPEVGIGAGALNPYTRDAAVVAMTMASLDDLAPGRLRLALGSGLPLRLAQMGIPFDDTIGKVSQCIDELRELWAGHRLVANPNVPPLQPMFQPPHHIPIYIAGYQRRFIDLCGQKAEGYLARPCESIPAIRDYRRRIDAAAEQAGRSGADIELAGYLLCFADESRRAALNRAKREPFVVYMMSVLSDVSLKRAGFPREQRDAIAAAWRAEEYHKAATLIPDELLNGFMLCGTPRDLAHQAWLYHQAGVDLPLLQPVLQDDQQTEAVIEAAAIYCRTEAFENVPEKRYVVTGIGDDTGSICSSNVADSSALMGNARNDLPLPQRLWRKAVAISEISRPFSFTASGIPVCLGGALAFADGTFDTALLGASLLGGVALHAGTNIVNEIYDVRNGADQITSPRASHALLKGDLTERQAFGIAYFAFCLVATIGLALTTLRGWPMLALGALGLIAGYCYTAPPFQYKYRSMGVPLVFVMMGPLMVEGSYYSITGRFSAEALFVSLPVGFLVSAILHGNEWRDISDDLRAGASTLSSRLGWVWAERFYLGLVVSAYLTVAIGVMLSVLPVYALLTVLSLPIAVVLLQRAQLGALGRVREIAKIDIHTAYLHLTFGLLFVSGLALAGAL